VYIGDDDSQNALNSQALGVTTLKVIYYKYFVTITYQ